MHVRDAVGFLVLVRRGQRPLARIDSFHPFASGREVEGKSAARGEAIERSSTRIAGRCHIVFALVEKDSGLLPVLQIDEELETVHANPDSLGKLSLEYLDLARQILLRPYRRI